MEHLDPRLLDAYAEQALKQDQKVRVERHLATCPDCRRRLEAHRRLIYLASRLPLEPVPENLAVQVHMRLSQARTSQRTARRLRQMGQLSLVLALAGLALVGSAWQQVMHIFAGLLVLLDGSFVTGIWQILTNSSVENWPGWAQTGLNWQAQLIQEVDVVLLAGAILLSLASFAGLARLLFAAQNRFPMDGKEESS
jgi:anti-sigma factor RsiW